MVTEKVLWNRVKEIVTANKDVLSDSVAQDLLDICDNGISCREEELKSALEEELFKVAENFFEVGASIEQVIEGTGLSREQLRSRKLIMDWRELVREEVRLRKIYNENFSDILEIYNSRGKEAAIEKVDQLGVPRGWFYDLVRDIEKARKEEREKAKKKN